MMGAPRYGGEEVFRPITRHGDRGVDFFFVLSGFIILFAHFKDIGRPDQLGRYLYRRFARVFPIYWLYTLVFVALLAVIGGTDAAIPSAMGDWITSLTLVRFTNATPPLPVAWTLFHEVAFYATFSILIVNRRLGFAAILLVGAISLSFFHFPREDGRTPFAVYTSAYNQYFLFGMGAYWLYRRGGSGIIELIIGLVIILITVGELLVPRQISPVTLALGMTLLLTAVTKFEASGKMHVPVLMTTVGDASYTIYLTHVNIEGALLKITKATRLQSILGNEMTYFIVLISTIALGCVAYFLIEKPLLRILGKFGRRMEASAQV